MCDNTLENKYLLHKNGLKDHFEWVAECVAKQKQKMMQDIHFERHARKLFCKDFALSSILCKTWFSICCQMR